MYRKSAQQGNIEAELKHGDYHYYGYGTPTDLEEAVDHYRWGRGEEARGQGGEGILGGQLVLTAQPLYKQKMGSA